MHVVSSFRNVTFCKNLFVTKFILKVSKIENVEYADMWRLFLKDTDHDSWKWLNYLKKRDESKRKKLPLDNIRDDYCYPEYVHLVRNLS